MAWKESGLRLRQRLLKSFRFAENQNQNKNICVKKVDWKNPDLKKRISFGQVITVVKSHCFLNSPSEGTKPIPWPDSKAMIIKTEISEICVKWKKIWIKTVPSSRIRAIWSLKIVVGEAHKFLKKILSMPPKDLQSSQLVEKYSVRHSRMTNPWIKILSTYFLWSLLQNYEVSKTIYVLLFYSFRIMKLICTLEFLIAVGSWISVGGGVLQENWLLYGLK